MQTVDPSAVGMDPERIEHLFGHVEKMRAEGWLFGGAFLLARHGKVVDARGVGQVEPEKGRSASVDDIFCQFSTTKPITATMLLMKADRGEVQLYEKVSAYIPEFGAAGKRHITVAQVLTHTAGFPTMPLDWPMAKWADWDATIARLCAQPLEYEPGAAVHYHALTGSWILAEIARRVDGGSRSFAQMCEDDLYRPLGMHDSHMGVRPDMHERRVPLQALDEGGAPFPWPFWKPSTGPRFKVRLSPAGDRTRP